METKQKTIKFMAVLSLLVGLIALPISAGAGDLEPAAAPDSTMKTLDEVEPRIPIPGANTPAAMFYISESGSYYLTGDRVASGTGIIVGVNDVTIDLMGYSLIGSGSANNGINMYGRSNVEIRNGTIRNFGRHGIIEYNTGGNGRNHRIINIRAVNNGQISSSYHGIYLAGSNHLVKECTASDNGGRGIQASSGCTITGNTAYNNGSYGIYASFGCTVTGNTVYSNGSYGIKVGNGNTVAGNTTYENQGYGIDAGENCTVLDNTALGNQGSYGIDVGSGSTVRGNTACGSQSGLRAGNGCTVIGNTAYNNERYGIYVNGNSLVYQNTAYNNNTSAGGYPNMWAGASCTVGENHAP